MHTTRHPYEQIKLSIAFLFLVLIPYILFVFIPFYVRAVAWILYNDLLLRVAIFADGLTPILAFACIIRLIYVLLRHHREIAWSHIVVCVCVIIGVITLLMIGQPYMGIWLTD